ncbi:hypothetical protein CDAR_493811 [Caerostris darwini]|uniref:Uncharacterized protein n=1 Tax=Caerostris darwini TaxID=1538125 RepID=A0AAV4VSI9_9ARAC|nr:hypothetical protein CDAR_493811 [Caerostris darwini]
MSPVEDIAKTTLNHDLLNKAAGINVRGIEYWFSLRYKKGIYGFRLGLQISVGKNIATAFEMERWNKCIAAIKLLLSARFEWCLKNAQFAL